MSDWQIPCVLKKCEDTVISMQKEQSHIHSLGAYGIIISGDMPVRRKELQNVFRMAS